MDTEKNSIAKMKDKDKTKEQLIAELAELRQSIAELEALEKELKLTEEALGESKDKYRDIFENVSDLLYFHDLEGNFIETNPAWKKEYGFNDDDLANLSLSDLIPESYEYQFEDYLKRVKEKGKDEGFMRVMTKDGRERVIEYRNSLIYDPTGPIGVRGLARDFTEGVHAGEALLESEQKYRTILETIEEGYYEVDIDGNFTFFNDSMCKILGYPKDELLGMNNRQYMDRENAKKMYQVFNRVYNTGKPNKGFDWQFTRKDGTKRYVETSVSLMKDAEGQRIGFRGILRDVTDRKLGEEALKESEEKYRTLFEDSLEAMSLTQQGKIVDVNPAWLRLHGFEDKREVIGMDIIDVIHPEDKRILVERRRMWPKLKERVYQLRDVRKDGSVVDVEVYSSGISLGGKDAILATLHDITERKRVEEEKRDLEEKLRHSEKMEAIGTLAGGVAHDLNNILSGLVSYPELVLMDLPEDSHLRRPILTMQKSGQKATAIVQDLLTLARRGVAVTEVVNLSTIVSEYLISPECGKLKEFHPNVKLQTDLEADLLPILGSPVHLSKTVMNLVSNAAEAMPSGGTIFISTENRHADSPIRGYDRVEKGDYVILTVSDSGIGIPAEDIGKIFEPFYTKKAMGRSGTGLGMAVVWGTVKDHKGYIDVQSREGKGTTFTLYFPVTRKEVDKEKSLLSIEDYTSKGESILVVDDVEEQREIASGMLRKLGYSVTAVSSGEKAVEYMKDNSVSLLVLDMIMNPGIDGLETYKRILEFHPGQKAIIVSGFSETDRVKEARRLGAGAYVRKPFLLEKIGIAVRGELDK
jgi:two-component system cell cycle sensor histidine kinase/response regulator CckA